MECLHVGHRPARPAHAKRWGDANRPAPFSKGFSNANSYIFNSYKRLKIKG